MEDEETREAAVGQLDRVLGFFPRVEGKATALLGLNSAVLAVGFLNVTPADFVEWFVILPLSLGCLSTGASLWLAYRTIFPNLKGGEGSLLYFREVAKRTERKYIDEFEAQSGSDYMQDVLSQVWRNSQILASKFDSLRWSFLAAAGSLIPWAALLVAVSFVHERVPQIN